jgi:hypothetical protein
VPAHASVPTEAGGGGTRSLAAIYRWPEYLQKPALIWIAIINLDPNIFKKIPLISKYPLELQIGPWSVSALSSRPFADGQRRHPPRWDRRVPSSFNT